MSSITFDLRHAMDYYPEVCRQCYGVSIELEKLERKFLLIKTGEEDLSQKHLEALVSECGTYLRTKVTQLSSNEINSIKGAFSNIQPKDEALFEKLIGIIGNIEVVSWILRLIDPINYGIIGPLLENLLFVRGNSQLEKYMDFLEDLEILAEKYNIDRIADTQTALWTLAHILNFPFLKHDTQFRHIYTAYDERPNFVKKIIAKNALKPIAIQDFLSKADLLLETDYVLAGISAAKELEIMIKALCEQSGIKTWEKNSSIGFRYLSVWELVDKLFQDKIITRKESETLKIWWFDRNHLMHEADVQMSREEVGDFIKGIFHFRESHFSKQYINKIRTSYLANISH